MSEPFSAHSAFGFPDPASLAQSAGLRSNLALSAAAARAAGARLDLGTTTTTVLATEAYLPVDVGLATAATAVASSAGTHLDRGFVSVGALASGIGAGAAAELGANVTATIASNVGAPPGAVDLDRLLSTALPSVATQLANISFVDSTAATNWLDWGVDNLTISQLSQVESVLQYDEWSEVLAAPVAKMSYGDFVDAVTVAVHRAAESPLYDKLWYRLWLHRAHQALKRGASGRDLVVALRRRRASLKAARPRRTTRGLQRVVSVIGRVRRFLHPNAPPALGRIRPAEG